MTANKRVQLAGRLAALGGVAGTTYTRSISAAKAPARSWRAVR